MRCAKCDAEIDATKLGGLCPVCLLDAALPDELAEADDSFRYDLIQEIARGGMGVVYRAIQHGSQRQVAVKMILAEQTATPGMMERFRAEAEAVASLDHPHILPIYEIGEHDGRPFYSMKFANGGTLRDRAADFSQPRDAARLMATIARAVHHAHERGILHRDLKPGNVLLDGTERTPYVSDFGLAKWIGRDSRLTLAQSALGTPHYIAPEQAAGSSARLTPAADIYSLGAILYELLTDRPPFVADTPLETLRLSRETEPFSLRSLKPAVPRDLEVICLKCLAKEPSARYASAAALAEDLERWLEGQTIFARPATSIERAWSWTKRNRIVAALATALIAAVLTMVITWHFFQRTPTRSNPYEPADKSIAVLPFENLSDEQNASFASGVQDEILTHLAKIADLKVISRTSVMSYTSGVRRNLREIGQQLGVAHILEGSVQRAGNRIRVNAQLIDARTDSHLWAQTYDRDLADVFAIQTEIARAISDQLQAKLSPAEKAAIEQPLTSDLAAFDLYSRAKPLLASIDTSDIGKNNLLKAVELLEQAVGRDPNFVQAYCLLASAHDNLYGSFDHTPARLALADAAVQTAQHLAPEAGEVHLALAQHFYQARLEFDHARTEIALAQKTLPNAAESFRWAGYIDRREGHWDECIRNLQRAAELDPRNRIALQHLAGTYQQMRRYPEAVATLDRALALAPKDQVIEVMKASVDLNSRADTHPLHSTIDSILAADPGAALLHADSWFHVALCERDLVTARRAIIALAGTPIRAGTVVLNHDFLEGLLARVSGDAAAAHAAFSRARIEQEKLVREQPVYGPAVCALGLIDAGLGRKEDALREGRRAVELLPVAKDAPGGVLMIQYFAIICGWVGEKDLAFEQLAIAARLPGPVHYGGLRLHPFWDPLRGDPRFDEILATLGPGSNSQATPASDKSIAVLPFLDLSQAKDQEYFCDGISEEIIDSLSKIEGLRVVSRTSSFSFKGSKLGVKEIAEKLGVQNLMEGSLRRDGNRIRITAQLINASDGFHLWSETYERELQGVFAVQDEITHAITSALKLKLVSSQPAPSQNPEAYELYLQGVFFSNKSTEEGLRKSLEFFQRSLEKDPNSARTYAGIAKAWNWLADAYVKPMDAYPQMKAAALKAVELDERLAEGHIWLGNAKRILDWDVAGCWAELDRALELDPNSAPAHSFRTFGDLSTGKKEEAVAEARASVRLDPLSPIISNFAAVTYLCLGKFDEAIAEGKRLMELDPNYIYESPVLADAYREKGMYPEAIASFQKAQQLTGAPQPGLAITYARIGRQEEARQILEELKKVAATKYIAAEEIAAVYVALGEKDEAFKWLERGYADHGGAFHAIGVRPVFRDLHSDPRFSDILRRIGLDPAKVLAQPKDL